MHKQTIINNEFITMWYYPEEKIIHHKFQKHTIYGKYYREFLDKGVELLKDNNACKWLSDDRTHVILTPEDLTWGINDWFPRVFDAGWKYWAIVRPIAEVGRMSIDQITYEYTQRGLIVELFHDDKNAFEWLKNK